MIILSDYDKDELTTDTNITFNNIINELDDIASNVEGDECIIFHSVHKDQFDDWYISAMTNEYSFYVFAGDDNDFPYVIFSSFRNDCLTSMSFYVNSDDFRHYVETALSEIRYIMRTKDV